MDQIRKATIEDIKQIKQIMDEGFASVPDKAWYVTDDEEFLKAHLKEEGYTLLYLCEGEVAGFLVVRHPRSAEDNLGRYLTGQESGRRTELCSKPEELLFFVAHMESASVLPKFRGRKIQQKLLLHAETLEKERGTVFLMATVHPENSYSAGNLEQIGYVCLMETEKYGGLKRKIMYKAI